jgi:molybdate-binding protein/transcriptional regulator with XRE-family HTH domain
VSRQALSAIEAGKSVPSTAVALQLARVLGCSVEALFALPDDELPVHVAPGAHDRVLLGQVGDRWVAHPVPEPTVPADAWLSDGRARPIVDRGALARQALVAGCAPLLGLLTGHLARAGARAAWLPTDSRGALRALAADEVHVAGLHLVDAGDDHRRLVREALPHTRCTLVHLVRWDVGLVVAPGNPLGLRSVHDLLRPDVRFVGRGAGSGAHALLRRLLGGAEEPRAVRVAGSHAEVATAVRFGLADAGLAIASVAEGLGFVPLGQERFDLAVRDEHLAHPAVAALCHELTAAAFRREGAHLAGHHLADAGQRHEVRP